MNILIPYGSRADAGLVEPLLKRIKAFELKLYPGEFEKSYHVMDVFLKQHPIDLVICTGDRIEMVAAACASFHNRIKIAHLYAGVLNHPLNTLDDINRHCITLWSDYQFVESKGAKKIVKNLCKTIGKIPQIYYVGITHLDDLSLDESLVPEKEFNLILYNPPTKGQEKINIFIGCNEDIRYYESLPRSQYLGLLKNCTLFVSNSSSAIYEAPLFLAKKQIQHLGNRNAKRSRVKMESGGSDQIKEVISELENLRDTHPREVELSED